MPCALPSLKTFRHVSRWLCCLCVAFTAVAARAHDVPRSQVEVRAGKSGADVTITASVVGFLLEYPAVQLGGEAMEAAVQENHGAMADAVARHFTLSADGVNLTSLLPGTSGSEFVPALKAVRLHLHYTWNAPPQQIEIRAGGLFPVDARHTVFVNIYDRDRNALVREVVLDRNAPSVVYEVGSEQSTFAVIRQFIREGIHHIFIGPDHILFIVGLLLMGGGLKRLLKIVTAFTIAHSITLVLATLDIVNPSPRIVEPLIALSIVCVGIHSLIQGHVSPSDTGTVSASQSNPAPKRRDARLSLAFCFGLIHGFGFASVLRELELPRAALGWSLLSFNIGVEMGQACIVLAVAPLLGLLWWRNPRAGKLVTTLGAWLVVLAGAYWFGQRLTS